jgi:GT2 family glycosyltransferase/SAM-dependent methyltransferase
MTAGLGGQTEIEHYHRYCLARDICAGLDVIDVASGEGYGSAIIAGTARHVVGIELDAGSIAHATESYKLANLRFLQGNALAMPLPDACADALVSFETLEHLRDHETFMREVLRVLRPGGLVLISTPDRIIYSAPGEPINPYHLRELTPPEFEQLLSSHFRNRHVWLQRAMVGSLLVPDRGKAHGWRSFERRADLIEASDGFARGRYMVGLASDSDLLLPRASSYFHSIDVDLACRALEREPGLLAQQADLLAQQADLLAQQADLLAVKNDLDLRNAALAAQNEALIAQHAIRDAARTAEHEALIAQHAIQDAARIAEHEAVRTEFVNVLEERFRKLQEITRQFQILSDRLRTARTQARESEERFRAIESSEMWHLTAPLRGFARTFPSLAILGRRSLKLVWWTLTLQLGRRLAQRRPAEVLLPIAEEEAGRRSVEMPLPLAEEEPKKKNLDLITVPAEPALRLEAVDIVICIHNALNDVRNCLSSVMRATLPPYRLVLVDDGSAAETKDYVADFARRHGATVIRHETAQGYTFAANVGLRAVTAPFFVMLNSDTIVTESWLDRMLDPMRVDPEVGLVGPMSNTASWQSAPALMENGEWAENALPDGLDPEDMARLIAKGSSRRPVPVGFLNGFCLLVRQSMMVQIGYFDDVTFGAGYGEENDYCIRARKAGWKLLVAEDAYVYHNQSRSYGHERRRALARNADLALSEKHQHETDILPQVIHCQNSLQLLGARLRLKSNLAREALIGEGQARFEGRRVAFLLPVAAAGGGANVIHQEARAMRRMGVDVWIINLDGFRASYEQSYFSSDLPTLYMSGGPDGLEKLMLEYGFGFDAVIATAYSSFRMLTMEGSVAGYYVQDLESRFFEEPGDAHRRDEALRSYTERPDVIRLTKSLWNRNAVVGIGGLPPIIVGPSVNLDAFHQVSDAGLEADRPVRVTAMVRPSTPRRNPDMTYRVLMKLHERFGAGVELACFGGTPHEMAEHGFDAAAVSAHGILSTEEVAVLLGRTDVFLDFSAWQAMGMTALEAMASGAAVVAPLAGGAAEFCVDGVSGLLVDTEDEAACLVSAQRLVADPTLRLALRRGGMEAASTFPPERAALHVLTALFRS